MGVALITVYIVIVPFLDYDSFCVRILYVSPSDETTALDRFCLNKERF